MKTVVVTGSTRGIGRGLAENFLQRGCKVIVSGRSQQSVDTVGAELAGRHGEDCVAGQACEVSSADQLQGLWDFALSRFGRVDVWINNAGVSMAAPAKNNKSAYLRFFFRKSTDTRPRRAKKVITSGSSKTTPKASSNLAEKLKYSFIEGMAWIISEEKPRKNLNPQGNTIK